jgi:hypothetical protein
MRPLEPEASILIRLFTGSETTGSPIRGAAKGGAGVLHFANRNTIKGVTSPRSGDKIMISLSIAEILKVYISREDPW